MEPRSPARRSVALVLAIAAALLAGTVFATAAAAYDRNGTRQEFVLRIGAQDDIETKNFFGNALSPDVWTANVLGPLTDGVLQADPDTDQQLPYVARGVDFDEDGTFERDEVGVFGKQAGTNQRVVTVYYDLNGAEFHDGTQATVEDLMFSYHATTKIPTVISNDVIKDQAGLAGSNYSTTRWLHIYKLDPLNVWEDEGTGSPSGDPYRVALQFQLQGDYYDFYRSTISVGLLPRALWEGTGASIIWNNPGSRFNGQTVDCTHADWGQVLDTSIWNGVPETAPNAWDLNGAAEWTVPDGCMIGTGPYVWDQWVPGSFAKLNRNPQFFTTVDASGYEYIHPPFLDGMRFQIYKTVQAAVFALQANEIDVISWSIPPDQVADLQNNPDITVSSNAEKGFFYLAYHMQIAGGAPWAYEDGDPTKADIGIPFRQAVAHTIDKRQIVTSLLQNFGVIADGVVSPVSTRWYNSSLPQYDFDLAQAAAILDTFSTDPGGTCQQDGTGCRSFVGIGSSLFDIQCPQADYDPIRAAACSMIETQMRAVGMNVKATHLAFSQITQNLDNRDMRMWILGWRIGSDPPDYLHAFFYSGNYPDGQNYPGYANPVFDQLVTDIRANLDPDSQADQVKYAQGIISTELPYDVLYYRTNIEAYRNDRTSNWTVGAAGSIFGGSYWSWIGVEPPKPGSLRATLTTASAVASGGSVSVSATVRNPDNDPVAGMDVTLRATGGTWQNPDPNDPNGLTTKGTTLVTGKFTTNYIAPTVTTKQKVPITVQAKDPNGIFGESLETSLILTVFPAGVDFLSVSVDPTSDLTVEGDPVLITVTVRDQDQIPVGASDVAVTVQPTASPGASPTTGPTDASGLIQVTFQVDDIGGVPSKAFELTFNATKAGYAEAPGRILEVNVLELEETPPPPDGIPALEIAVVVMAILAVAVIVRWRQRW